MHNIKIEVTLKFWTISFKVMIRKSFHYSRFFSTIFSTFTREDKMASFTPTPSYALPIRDKGNPDSENNQSNYK